MMQWILSFFVLLFSATFASADLTAELDAIAASAFKSDEPGAAVIVVKDGEVVLRKGYGMADLELEIPIEPDMVFRIGSVTKQFTAAAILLLEERGKLSVSDDIRKHLPDYPTGGKTITIAHLLTHTSGIRSYTDMASFREQIREDLSVDDVIDLFENEPLAFEPGEKYAYNNSGFFLLGAIIEKASGETYETFLQENVFDPLEMTRSYYGSASTVIPRRVRGYTEQNETFVNAAYLSMTIPYAAGSLLSTVDDLAKWDGALYTTDLLSEASLDKWWKPFHLSSGDSTHYAFGWGVNSYLGHPVVGHGGGINGFTCSLMRMPEDRVFVAVLTNRNAPSPSPGLVARKLAAAVIGEPLVEPKSIEADAEVLKSYAGVYRVNENAKHVVRFGEGRLYLRRFGDEHPEGGRVRNPGPSERLNRVEMEIFPLSETEFFVKDSSLRMRFESGGNALVVEDWGREETGHKTDEPFDDESVVLATVRKLVDAVAALDVDAMRSVFDPEARLVQTFEREGVPETSTITVDEFLSSIAAHDGPKFLGRIWGPEIRIADNLATVWVSYAFYVGDDMSHCGETAFQLARTNVGWKIIAIAETRRTEGCQAPEANR